MCYYWGITANGKGTVDPKNVAAKIPLMFADMHRKKYMADLVGFFSFFVS